VRREVVHLARQVADDVAEEKRPAARVVVKVRYAPFITRTHGHQLAAPASDPAVIEQAALAALDGFAPVDGGAGRPVRLLGVRAEFAG
jgi:nucleotidyltransferase/DNA polymerase involved in DNA repair